MKKLPLIARIIIWLLIGISLGVICRTTHFAGPIIVTATFRQLVSTFLGSLCCERLEVLFTLLS